MEAGLSYSGGLESEEREEEEDFVVSRQIL